MKHIFRTLCAVALLFSFASCTEKEDTGVEVTVDKLVGAWKSEYHKVDDSTITNIDVWIVMNNDNTGYVLSSRVGGKLDFNYTISGSNVKIRPKGLNIIELPYSVSELTETAMTISGDYIPGENATAINYTGHYVKISLNDVPSIGTPAVTDLVVPEANANPLVWSWNMRVPYGNNNVNVACVATANFDDNDACSGAFMTVAFENMQDAMLIGQLLAPYIMDNMLHIRGSYNFRNNTMTIDFSESLRGKTRAQIMDVFNALVD